ncbi:MAG TPA: CTP synthase [Candidatus Cloacimonetes bacterium]|nr:CTP synthase [Candidatus Cloacimonadota bacterium]HEX38210.1 CTP synthase [Candidatus Cloacimonadota bacterium]
MKIKTKHIFITGGVVSSLGKGIASASIGYLLKKLGYEVTIQKLDPYLNVDPGTMSPFQHGEVFVTDDGAETDLDLGHYERYLDISLNQKSNTTTGQIYDTVIQNERRGVYLGKTVQVIPHITNEIKKRITSLDKSFDIVISEIGGTVGDIESLPFLETIRQFRLTYGAKHCFFIHLTLVPYISAAGESKTKPTQHSVIKLREIGIQPDMLICRTSNKLTKEMMRKISLFTNVYDENVIEGLDTSCIYQIPILFYEQGVHNIICKYFDIPSAEIDFLILDNFINKFNNPEKKVTIALCGKYVRHQDAYKSITESLIHAGVDFSAKIFIKSIDTDKLFPKDKSPNETKLEEILGDVDGILIPGGFGVRGIEGKIEIVNFARTHKIPFFGICLGMQCAVIEFARNVLGYEDAHSAEFDEKTPHPVIDFMPEQKDIENMGGTMRLGAYPCVIKKGTLTHNIYKNDKISERHRHRYEFNNEYRKEYEEKGMKIAGTSPDDRLVEIIEIPDHPFFIGVQFHPEFKSRLEHSHPIFHSFIEAALQYKEEKDMDRT